MVILNRIYTRTGDDGTTAIATGARRPELEPLRIVQAQVDRLEAEIDTLNKGLGTLRSFVLPGGTPAAAHLHLARTVSRRAARLMVELAGIPGGSVAKP